MGGARNSWSNFLEEVLGSCVMQWGWRQHLQVPRTTPAKGHPLEPELGLCTDWAGWQWRVFPVPPGGAARDRTGTFWHARQDSRPNCSSPPR